MNPGFIKVENTPNFNPGADSRNLGKVKKLKLSDSLPGFNYSPHLFKNPKHTFFQKMIRLKIYTGYTVPASVGWQQPLLDGIRHGLYAGDDDDDDDDADG